MPFIVCSTSEWQTWKLTQRDKVNNDDIILRLDGDQESLVQ